MRYVYALLCCLSIGCMDPARFPINFKNEVVIVSVKKFKDNAYTYEVSAYGLDDSRTRYIWSNELYHVGDKLELRVKPTL